MKRSNFILLLLLCLAFNSCQQYFPQPISCTWTRCVTVHLEDLYLGLPCEECYKDADYAMLYSFINSDQRGADLEELMKAATNGFWENCECSWKVTAAEASCTEDTREKTLSCDQNNLKFLKSNNTFVEAPLSNDADPRKCKRHFELKLTLHTGETLLWQKDWVKTEQPDCISADFLEETFYVASYSKPLPVQIFKAPKRCSIYINTQFQTI